MNISKLFQGRINRRNWLLGLVSSIGLLIVFAFIFQSFEQGSFFNTLFGLILIVSMIGIMIFNLSLHVRRLHDLGVSGWYFILVYIFSLFGLLYLALAEGQEEENRFGKAPPHNVIFPNQILGMVTGDIIR